MAPRALVLVVEDDPDLAEVTAAILESEGYTAVLARDGGQALRLLESGVAPGAIVCDMMMPHVDGFTFLAEYARRPPPRAPVVAMSAFSDYVAAALEAGAAAALDKPFTAEALVETVSRLLAGQPPAPRAPPPAAPEDQRLRAVLNLRLDEPAPTAALDRFAGRVASIFEVAICLVSVITRDRQYWHAACGLPEDLAAARGSPREDSFCTHAVVARAALVVQDAAANPIFRHNPFVREHGIRFYAGVPLLGRFGDALGTLCLLDSAPRVFDYFDLELLGALARRVLGELEWRERRGTSGAPGAAFRYLSHVDEELEILGRPAFLDALLLESLRAAERGHQATVAAVALPEAALAPAVRALEARFERAHLGRLALHRVGLVVPGAPPEAVAEALREAAGAGAQVELTGVSRAPGAAESQLRALESALGSAGLAPPRDGP